MAIIQKNATKENKRSIDERISKLLNNSELNSIEDLLKILPAKDELSQEDLFTMVYCTVNDFIQAIGGQKSFRHSNNNDPAFTDAEVITIMLVGQLSLQDSQRAWYHFTRKNFLYLFPRMCCRSQYSRRLLQLHDVICYFQKNLCSLLNASYAQQFLIDSFPIQLCNLQRVKSSSQPFELDGASYGYCASKKLFYYGFKGHLVTDLRGVPVFFCLTSARTSDLHAFEFVVSQMLQHQVLKQSTLFIGDKGYLGKEFQENILKNYGVTLLSMEREYQADKYGPSPLNGFLKPIRKLIETTIDLFSVELEAGKTKRRTCKGLVNSLISKLAAFNIANFFNYLLDEPLLQIKGFIY